MNSWFSILDPMVSLLGTGGAVVFALAFWRLHLVAPTPATRCGVIGTLVTLGVWFFYVTIWVISMIPLANAMEVYRIYNVPYLMDTLWIASVLAFITAILCLAWTLHRGIQPKDVHG